MERATETSSESWQQQLALAKILVRKYGVLHEFHSVQLKNYCVACAPMIIGGTAEVNMEEKSIVFRLQSDFHYYLNGGKVADRSKYSIKRLLSFLPFLYDKQVGGAYQNLNIWCKELFWGESTKIRLFIDGKQIFGNSK